MRVDRNVDQRAARQARAVVASVVASALLGASVLTALHGDAPVPRQRASQPISSPPVGEATLAPDPALGRIDAVVHHG